MPAKVYSPKVLHALAESLTAIYWYVKDLKGFLIRCGVPSAHVARLPWDYKRTGVNALIDELSAKGPAGTGVLGALIGGVVEQDEGFKHLARVEDGKAKVKAAREAVRDLKNLIGDQSVVERVAVARSERKTEAERARIERDERVAALATLKASFMAMFARTDVIQRGIDFQKWLHALFALHDLDPRGSLASPGEQIDGSIRIDGQVLLLEARWTADQVAPDGVRDFVGKLDAKLDSTLGLMISVNGFTDNAKTKAASGGRLVAIFVDGQDLYPVLEGVVDLRDVLKRKLRHAAERGEPMYRVGS